MTVNELMCLLKSADPESDVFVAETGWASDEGLSVTKATRSIDTEGFEEITLYYVFETE